MGCLILSITISHILIVFNLFCFGPCCIKTLSVRLDHWRAMGCRADKGPGRNERRQGEAALTARGGPPVHATTDGIRRLVSNS